MVQPSCASHIMKMKSVVLIVNALLLVELVQCRKTAVAVEQPLLADLIFTDGLLYERDAASVADCAGTCLTTDNCAMFTLTPPSWSPSSSASSTATSGSATSRSRCRGHSFVVRSGSGKEPAPGTQFFMFTPRVSSKTTRLAVVACGCCRCRQS